MQTSAPATPGMALADVETPALIADLDLLERNLARMQQAADSAGLRLRPHGKAHKTPEIARRQIALGAVGICVQKVSEAEVFAAAGIPDILVTNQVVTPAKLDRLVALAGGHRIGICVDNAIQIDRLAAAIARAALPADAAIDVYVEIDVGQGRCGLPVGREIVALAQRITAERAMRFAGLQAYHGAAQHLRHPDERRAAIASAAGLAARARDLLAEAGLPCPHITGGGTGSHAFEAASGVHDEIQPGSYALMDADYARNDTGETAAFEHALRIRTSVISTAVPGQAVVDLGLKGASVDSGLPVALAPGLEVTGLSDEHCTLRPGPGMTLRPGDAVDLIPGHVDPTCNLHDWIVACRGDRVEELWPIAARGPGL